MTLSCILLALILDAFLGEPVWIWSKVPHPAVLMGKVIKWGEIKYNNGINRKSKGILFIIFFVIFLAILGYLIEKLPISAIWKTLIVAMLLSHKSLTEHVTAVSLGLQKNISQGRIAIAMIVGRDTTDLEETDIARSAIESAAENFSDGIIAPLFWFLVGGLPGILIYKFVNTSDSMIGYKNIQYNQFGWAAARLDDLLNWIPAGPINDLSEVFNDPQVVFRGLVKKIDNIPTVVSPYNFSGSEMNISKASPKLGENTDEILTYLKNK